MVLTVKHVTNLSLTSFSREVVRYVRRLSIDTKSTVSDFVKFKILRPQISGEEDLIEDHGSHIRV